MLFVQMILALETAVLVHLLLTPIRDKQFLFFLKKVSIKAEKEDCFFVYLLLIINHITK